MCAACIEFRQEYDSGMNNKVLLLTGALLVIIGGFLVYAGILRPDNNISEAEDVVQKPAPELVQPVTAPALATNGPLSQKIRIDVPVSANVSSPFVITGKAPGPWYFEASFPIIISDKDGNKIAVSYGQAQADWMTTELVPFAAQIDVGAYTGPVTINLLRDNPSGLPENDDSASFDLVIQ
ncbi:MAG: hypothetical protein RLZZ342_732 [Candidatus Parcubacteria bacterium]|jgi:hypothetical protein